MNHVLVSISIHSGYENSTGHRTSDGWVCDSRSFEYPIFKFSAPFASLSDSNWNIILGYLGSIVKEGEWEEGFYSGRDSYSYSEYHTIEFVLFLNSLSIPNTVFSCIGKVVEFGFSWENGELSTTEGCPVDNVDDIKLLLLSCKEYGIEYNPSWVSNLIKSSKEDLAPFFREANITIDCEPDIKIGICHYTRYYDKSWWGRTKYIIINRIELYTSILNVDDNRPIRPLRDLYDDLYMGRLFRIQEWKTLIDSPNFALHEWRDEYLFAKRFWMQKDSEKQAI